ncbi:MAG: hypothetical protein A3J58_03460 [Candidatus Sungbacteria bacterium RIFCSPHIGHO2_02_FULL_52_23]|uniref:NYN domain-containing protein n=1 Tax=Candidatus Sungbacteria bacterium RIFCSPHIGHO2_02_FULL_52_23 TaxID=1802274 RepID=A0A1G2KXJ0_9BACT|nr:MAG: hypothetical protein A3J58_03460 [Candidatus Sungbacteria bacterium RIFCSPHIGHO2_02_FULL_52_23]
MVSVIVDAGSFHNQMRILEIGTANLKNLLEVIREGVATELKCPAAIRFAKYVTAAEHPQRFEKYIKADGFDMIPTNPHIKDSDDAEVNRLIIETNPAHVAALVVVTTDLLDFVRSLERKRAQDIRIFVAAITSREPGGGYPLSEHSRRVIRENGYVFIDLETHKEALFISKWVDRKNVPIAEAVSVSVSEQVSEPAGDMQRIGVVVPLGENQEVPFDFMTAFAACMKKNHAQIVSVAIDAKQARIVMDIKRGSASLQSVFMTMGNFLIRYSLKDFRLEGGNQIQVQAKISA